MGFLGHFDLVGKTEAWGCLKICDNPIGCHNWSRLLVQPKVIFGIAMSRFIWIFNTEAP